MREFAPEKDGESPKNLSYDLKGLWKVFRRQDFLYPQLYTGAGCPRLSPMAELQAFSILSVRRQRSLPLCYVCRRPFPQKTRRY